MRRISPASRTKKSARMTSEIAVANKGKIDAYLLAQMYGEVCELARTDVDRYTKFIYWRLREGWWTLTRLAGAAHWHDGAWRKPSADEAARRRPLLEGDIPAPARDRRLLIDLSGVYRSGKATGIQRVAQNIARNAVESGGGLPVVIEQGRLFSFFRHASLPEEVEIAEGDRFLMLDASWNYVTEYPPIMAEISRKGGSNIVCLFDIIPLLYPAAFTPAVVRSFEVWMKDIVASSDAAVGISRSVCDEFLDFVSASGAALRPDFRLGWWRLGADFTSLSKAPPSRKALGIAAAGPFFLSVGTLEPRKGYSVALAAFELLWSEGSDARYVIVGRRGWNMRALESRIREHPQFGRRLFWLDDASDADLAHLYQHTRGLIAPSIAEGFGLPLVEAAHHGAPVIASDIPVFREVGGDAIAYFDLLDAGDLARRVREALANERRAPRLAFCSWRESANELMTLIANDAYQYGSVHRSQNG